MKKGWEIKKFEDLIEESKIGLIKNTKEQGNGNSFRYLKMDSITSDNNLVHDKYVYVNATKDELKKYSLNDGDFLFNTRNSYELVGKTCVFSTIDDEPTLFNNNIMRVVFKKNISSRFVNYAFSSEQVKERLQKLKSGTTSVVGIYYNGLKNLEIPLPPLPEQQRIVSILDEAFAAIAKAKANAEQNLKNAKELFESYLQGVFENGDWEQKSIQEVTKVINGFAFASKDFKSTNTVKSIKITNVGVKEFVEEVDNYLPEKFKDTLQDVQVREGNIVIALTRTIISAGLKVAVVPKSYDGALVNQRVAALVPHEKVIDKRFLYNFLTTDGVAKYVLAHVNTLMQPNLSINDLRTLPIPCLPIEEQQAIVQKLDGLSAETKKLEAIYQKKIDDLEELKKSILQKAFAGELKTEKAVLSV